MNQIQQIQRINQQELDSGATASWHDQVSELSFLSHTSLIALANDGLC